MGVQIVPREEHLKSGDGMGLFMRSWMPTKPLRAVVLVVPGFNSHSGYYQWAADQLVVRWACRLCGRSPRARQVRRRALLCRRRLPTTLPTLRVAVRRRHGARHPGLPVFLLGHSAGGVVACLYALDHQAELAGLICESFAFQVPAPDFALAVFKGLSHVCAARPCAAPQERVLLARPGGGGGDGQPIR